MFSLGDFDRSTFADNPQALILYVFFIVATFITQLTMLNMLIAIMGDTFGRVFEQKEINATKTKLELMSDLSTVMSSTEINDPHKVYLFVVGPSASDEVDGDEMQGAINSAKNETMRYIDELREQMDKQNAALVEQLDSQVSRIDRQGTNIKTYIYD